MKKVGTQTGNSEPSLNNRIQDMEERISGIDDMTGEMITSMKEIMKYKRKFWYKALKKYVSL